MYNSYKEKKIMIFYISLYFVVVAFYLDFLKELSSVRMASINEVPPGHNTNPPVLIHCNEGSGRSGVTLASDLLLYTLDHNQVCLVISIIYSQHFLFNISFIASFFFF